MCVCGGGGGVVDFGFYANEATENLKWNSPLRIRQKTI